MPPEEEDLTTIATFPTSGEAETAKVHLESEGIEAFVIGGMSAGVMPFLPQGVRLQVKPSDAERAREVLGFPE